MKKRYIITAAFTGILLRLTHHFWLGTKGHENFDFLVFTIVFVLGWLLNLKISSYLADFKNIENKSRIDIIFLAVFFVLLFIPMSNISQEKVSKTENRKLADWQPIILSKTKINYNFGKDFDNWFNDRFFLRKFIVKTYSDVKYYLAYQYYSSNKGFINKKNNWMSTTLNPEKSTITAKEKDNIVVNVRKLKNFCEKNNIKLYIIIPPRKEEICKKELYPIIADMSLYAQTSEIIDYIYKQTGVKIIYPYEKIENYHKHNFAYFKTDHHWTDEAAYIGYLEIMNEVKKDFPDIYINKPNDFNYSYNNKVRVNPDRGFFQGITSQSLNLHNKKILDVDYKYYEHKNSNKIVKHYIKDKEKNIWFNNYIYNIKAPNMTLFGDSFGLNLLPSIVYSFKNTQNIYTYVLDGKSKGERLNIKQFEKDILDNNSDVLVVCFSEITRLGYLYRENE
ncbi:MAG: hypothetical protein ACI37Q_03220 [Candidatus Gastranaerophilaceae bacterium]